MCRRNSAPEEATTISGHRYKSYPLQGGVAVHITENAETHGNQEFRPKTARVSDAEYND
jgi:hypothetical protein